MSCCGLCNHVFRDNYNLTKHLSRSKPCVKENISLKEGKNQSLDKQKDSLDKQKDSLDKQKKCCFCLNNFFNKETMKRHQQKCKQRDDPVRLLEIKQKIEPVLPDSKTCCRFCDKELSRISYLNKHLIICKKREEYYQLLISTSVKVSNYVINNNNFNNIININIPCQENMNHIQTEYTIGLIRELRKEFSETQIVLMAGNLICLFDNYIRENPQNQNIIIPEPKSLYGNVKTAIGWKKESVDRCLNKAFKNSAKELYIRKEAIDNHNKKVFESKINREIFSEVKPFSINGFAANTIEVQKIKTSFKVDKLKKRELDF